jgi:chromosomal replication initiator protein
MDGERLWQAVSDTLRPQMTAAAWKTWFDGIRCRSVDDTQLTLTVPSALVRDRIHDRFLPTIQKLASDIAGAPLAVHMEIHSQDAAQPGPPTDVMASGEVTEVDQAGAPRSDGIEHSRLGTAPAAERGDPPLGNGQPFKGEAAGPTFPPHDDLSLNPRYTFDTFVIGASNRFAHAAARCVAETPAKAYNPLFIHGGTGLGKTHLLHAIGNYVRENFRRNQRIRYVSTETFLNDFVESIRTNKTLVFKRYYRECDLLLVDDIHFMEGKEALQEEFFYTFNTLHEAGRQIVITSDRPPRAIATLEERLRSRFLSGLTTDVQPPELETRIAILRQKSNTQQVTVPDEVLELIATNVTDNIRELEGAFTRISAYASLNKKALTRPLAEELLSDIFSHQNRQITPDAILKHTSELFGFSVEDLCGPSRRRPLVAARQVSMYVFRNLTDFSYPAIAKQFGDRDHTTVIHAVDKITRLMQHNHALYDKVSELIRRVKTGG